LELQEKHGVAVTQSFVGAGAVTGVYSCRRDKCAALLQGMALCWDKLQKELAEKPKGKVEAVTKNWLRSVIANICGGHGVLGQ
jgi:hypothetical protein